LFKYGGQAHIDFGWPENELNASPSDCDDTAQFELSYLFSEMLSEREMAQHFSGSMMPWCVPYIFQIVVFVYFIWTLVEFIVWVSMFGRGVFPMNLTI
jgi:hypothetical protein